MHILEIIPIFLIFLWGGAIGSFLNVVIYRLPAGISILWPPSRCPHCFHRLSFYENVPVFGWLWLGGRCRKCKARIALRYPLVEAGTGLLFLLVFSQFGLSLITLEYWLFFSWLLALSLIDFDTMTLPNSLTQSGLIVGLGFQFLLGLGTDGNLTSAINNFMVGIMGAVVGLWVLEIIAFLGTIAFGKAAMGAGDPKLAAMIGAWLGWQYVLMAGFFACVFGAIVGVSAIAMGFLKRKQPMAFGPFLAIGGAITALWGKEILAAYLSSFFPISPIS
jgi:leader peptidase (prepilin peptidase)/N-methyltransferase